MQIRVRKLRTLIFVEYSSETENPKYQHYHLQGENHRHAYGEFWVFCFVPHKMHTQQHTTAAAQDSNTHEPGLRNPPEVFPGTVFINQHIKKPGCIDYKQVQENIVHK